MTARVPAPFAARPARLDDAEAVSTLMNETALALVGEPYATPEEMRAEWEAPGRDLAATSLVVESADGALAAVAFVESMPPHLNAFAYSEVAPAFRGDGLGPPLVAWVESRAPELVAAAPAGEPSCIHWAAWVGERGLIALLGEHGYVPVRHFWRMAVALDEAPATPSFPEGVTVRTFRRGADEEAVWAATVEAFKDHWGNDEETLDYWLYDKIEGPAARFDADLWFLAMDGDEVAGVAICQPDTTADPGCGYVRDLCVRRPWRRRGVARALLLSAFTAFHARGTTRASLHVDAANPTGALALYEGVGMTAHPRFEIWEKPIEPDAAHLADRPRPAAS